MLKKVVLGTFNLYIATNLKINIKKSVYEQTKTPAQYNVLFSF